MTHTAKLSSDVAGNITRINHALEKIPQSLERHREDLVRLDKELESAKEEAGRPFPQEEELAEKSARLAELNAVLDRKEKGRGPEADGQQAPGQGVPPGESVCDADEAAEGAGKNVQGAVQELPAREADGRRDMSGKKPSILEEIKAYQPPAPVQPVPARGMEREVV